MQQVGTGGWEILTVTNPEKLAQNSFKRSNIIILLLFNRQPHILALLLQNYFIPNYYRYHYP